MNPETLQMPAACRTTAAAVELDPLNPGPEAEAHMKRCTACSEARVAYLAQEEVPLALAPAGYFDRLPSRVLGKLPTSSRSVQSRHLFWGAAAALLLAVGVTAFSVGRANRTPLVEASLPRITAEAQEVLPDSPFQDSEDAVTALTALSPEDAEAVIRTLAAKPAPAPAEK